MADLDDVEDDYIRQIIAAVKDSQNDDDAEALVGNSILGGLHCGFRVLLDRTIPSVDAITQR